MNRITDDWAGFCLLPSAFILPFIALARIRTRNAAFEAPHDLRFTTRADLLLLATRFWLLASLPHVPGRTRTSTPELEAPNDLPFHHGDSRRPKDSKRVAYLRRPAAQRKAPNTLPGFGA